LDLRNSRHDQHDRANDDNNWNVREPTEQPDFLR
jgi:hypothetical protein